LAIEMLIGNLLFCRMELARWFRA